MSIYWLLSLFLRLIFGLKTAELVSPDSQNVEKFLILTGPASLEWEIKEIGNNKGQIWVCLGSGGILDLDVKKRGGALMTAK